MVDAGSAILRTESNSTAGVLVSPLGLVSVGRPSADTLVSLADDRASTSAARFLSSCDGDRDVDVECRAPFLASFESVAGSAVFGVSAASPEVAAPASEPSTVLPPAVGVDIAGLSVVDLTPVAPLPFVVPAFAVPDFVSEESFDVEPEAPSDESANATP
jgi:hypothetical protein